MSHASTPATPAAVSAAAATSTDATAPGKSHYVVLDGLRGIAALMVVMFHTFEAYAGGDPTRQIINHGYLAVDFFFLLSGFVIAYAYDDRWGEMERGEFYLRRLIRLQPMVVLGSLFGAALFYLQAGGLFPKIAVPPVWQMLLVMMLGCTLLPLPKQLDIRGWDEIHPINGPAWSLFYEYVANVAYALVLRRLSTRALTVLAVLAAALLLEVALLGERRDLIGGWSLDAAGVHIGLARLCYPFIAGMLLMRSGWRLHSRHAFAISAALLIVALALPRMGDTPHHWSNGLYDAACVLLLFPLVVAIGAGDKAATGKGVRVARFFGDLSFPLYITHYPLIYLYTAWVVDQKVPARVGAPMGVALVIAAVVVAYVSLKLYDEPVRRWLGRRLRDHVARHARAGEPAAAPSVITHTR
ncbi:acyltransferase family protein [Sphingomonas sp. DT-51]|uniref:acyltransferase family protein n=1 Tax=Sphingomonas sp. DT-51 TaxID=3396165 RepID=UPI003F1B3D09